MAGKLIQFGYLHTVRGKEGLAAWTWAVHDTVSAPTNSPRHNLSVQLQLNSLLTMTYQPTCQTVQLLFSCGGNKSLVEKIKEQKLKFCCDSPYFLHLLQTTRSITISFPAQIPLWEEVVRETTNCAL